MRIALAVVALLVLAAAAAWYGPARTTLFAALADVTLGERESGSGAERLAAREAMRPLILGTLGQAPDAAPDAPRLLALEEREAHDGLELGHATFSLPDGDTGVALVAYPEGPPKGVVVALHQTTDAGMAEVMGLDGRPDLNYGETLAREGFLVVAPDTFTTGERMPPAERWSTAPFYVEHPDWSAMGKMLWDHRAAVTVGLEIYRQRYGGEAACVATVGHSLGAHNALFLAAYDERIDAVVANAGYERIASDDEAIRWARDAGFIYIPALTDATRGAAPLPWDWEDVLVQIYPRSALIMQGLNDLAFTHEISVAQTARAAESAWRAGGGADRFDAQITFAGHFFPEGSQRRSAAWIERQCAKGPLSPGTAGAQ